MTDVEIIDRINAASRAQHDETMLVLAKLVKKVDKLEGFRNRIMGMAMACSMLISAAWTVLEHVIPWQHAGMGK